ncbi:uncharacterized protein CDAR_417651 [Caerostris darwini]|uniref:Uncharacterized protein n=1 Tax=Caerostris darwini TaxID=1538125 RepID=A0AAV4VBG4_9ARAC|nr:uncharacterized protein CDAR_417651 [Caerostris darwini]
MAEETFEFPFLTPVTHTEPFSEDFLTSSTSKYITPENTDREFYDQILPSRYTTTPLSRRYVYKIINRNQIDEQPSTLATTIHAPPPFYQAS